MKSYPKKAMSCSKTKLFPKTHYKKQEVLALSKADNRTIKKCSYTLLFDLL